MVKNKTALNFDRFLPYLYTIGGGFGLWAAFQLTLDKLEILKNPNFIPGCNINPVVACGSVIKSSQAAAFGFPNPLIGLFGFAVVITIGMGLFAGAKYKRWFWLGLQAGATFGLLFVHWLIFQSLYRIGALCPYCMVVWSVTIPIFWYTTLYNLQAGNLKAPAKLTSFLGRHHGDLLGLWYLVVILLILNRFWYYWSTLV